jgi:hypothetical protein
MAGKLQRSETIDDIRMDVEQNYARCYWNEDSMTKAGGIPREHTIEPAKFLERIVKACRREVGETKKGMRSCALQKSSCLHLGRSDQRPAMPHTSSC